MALRQVVKRLNPVFLNSVRNYSSADKIVDSKLNDKTGITTITLQRPPVNSLNYELLSQLHSALIEAGKNKTKGVILTSSLPTVFSGGLDIMEMYKPTQEGLRKFWTSLQDVWLALYGSEYPTVAAINGHSPAGACLIALCCEYRIMLSKATTGLNETQIGIVAPAWFQTVMRDTIGSRRAEIALTEGQIFSSDEALRVGMTDEIATDENDLMAKSEAFIKRFAKIPYEARSITKLRFRSKDLKVMKDTRDQDVEDFILYITQPYVQKYLGLHVEALKKKSAK